MTLKEARELTALTQSALDRKAGIPSGTVHDIESGRNANPSYGIVARLVLALQAAGLKGVTAEAIFGVPDLEARR